MLGGQSRSGSASVQAGVGIIAAVAAKVARRTQTDVDVRVAEDFLRQFEVDVLVGHDRRVERIRPDGDVGHRVFADEIPLRVVFGRLRVGERPLGAPVAGRIEGLLRVHHGDLHRDVRGRNALGREVDQPCVETSRVVVPPVVVGEGGVTVAAYVGLAAHRRTAVVVDLLGARRDCVVSGPASRTAGCVLVGGVRAAPLDRSVGIAADEGVHLRIPALLRGVDYDADTVLVAVVGAEEVVRAVADGP